MWHGVTYVEPSRRPVIHEGFSAAQMVVTNAGPGVVDLLVWHEPMPKWDDPPTFKMRMPPGNTRSANGPMIAVAFSEEQGGSVPTDNRFAAVAWRVVP
jgi:hypothetical protein